MPRKYEMGRRAEQHAQTRQRIVEATVALHEDRGLVRTTVSDIAEHAGVERATVYRHFPDERALFSACTSHFIANHPLPDPAPWQAILDPAARLQVALTEVYSFHRRTERMTDRAERDLPDVPTMREVLAPAFAHWARARDTLVLGWPVAEGRQALLAAVIGHTLAFSTWRSLVREQGLTEDEAVRAIVAMVRGVADQR